MDKKNVVDLKKWADITIERWQLKIALLKFLPTHSGDLMNSFRAHVENDANGDAAKITFTFLYYGYYVDAGAGPGRRMPKVWYNKTYWREYNQLGRLLAEQYGQEWVDEFVKSIEALNYELGI